MVPVACSVCGKVKMMPRCHAKRSKNHFCFKKCQALFVKKTLTVHGMGRTNFYSVWRGLRSRCEKKNHRQYKNYGGRGIKVCKRWGKFENFYKDMFPTYKKGLSIDRINNNGNYSPRNCRWTDSKTQCNNLRKTLFVYRNGEKIPLTSVAEIFTPLYQRLVKRHKTVKKLVVDDLPLVTKAQ